MVRMSCPFPGFCWRLHIPGGFSVPLFLIHFCVALLRCRSASCCFQPSRVFFRRSTSDSTSKFLSLSLLPPFFSVSCLLQISQTEPGGDRNRLIPPFTRLPAVQSLLTPRFSLSAPPFPSRAPGQHRNSHAASPASHVRPYLFAGRRAGKNKTAPAKHHRSALPPMPPPSPSQLTSRPSAWFSVLTPGVGRGIPPPDPGPARPSPSAPYPFPRRSDRGTNHPALAVRGAAHGSRGRRRGRRRASPFSHVRVCVPAVRTHGEGGGVHKKSRARVCSAVQVFLCGAFVPGWRDAGGVSRADAAGLPPWESGSSRSFTSPVGGDGTVWMPEGAEPPHTSVSKFWEDHVMVIPWDPRHSLFSVTPSRPHTHTRHTPGSRTHHPRGLSLTIGSLVLPTPFAVCV